MTIRQLSASSTSSAAQAYDRATDYALFLPRPFFARHAWVGYALFGLCAAGFLALALLVRGDNALTAWDLRAAQSVNDWAKQQPLPLVLFLRFWSWYGRDGEGVIALLLAAAWIRRKARRELWMLVFGMMAGEVWFQAFGGLVQRARPDFKDPLEKLIGYGFPSGHATTTTLLVMLILVLLLPVIRTRWRRWALVGVCLLVLLTICFSRLCLGLHYPTDLLAGILLGLGWGGLVHALIDRYFWRTYQNG